MYGICCNYAFKVRWYGWSRCTVWCISALLSCGACRSWRSAACTWPTSLSTIQHVTSSCSTSSVWPRSSSPTSSSVRRRSCAFSLATWKLRRRRQRHCYMPCCHNMLLTSSKRARKWRQVKEEMDWDIHHDHEMSLLTHLYTIDLLYIFLLQKCWGFERLSVSVGITSKLNPICKFIWFTVYKEMIFHYSSGNIFALISFCGLFFLCGVTHRWLQGVHYPLQWCGHLHEHLRSLWAHPDRQYAERHVLQIRPPHKCPRCLQGEKKTQQYLLIIHHYFSASTCLQVKCIKDHVREIGWKIFPNFFFSKYTRPCASWSWCEVIQYCKHECNPRAL